MRPVAPWCPAGVREDAIGLATTAPVVPLADLLAGRVVGDGRHPRAGRPVAATGWSWGWPQAGSDWWLV